MFFKHFITSAVVGFITALIAGLAILSVILSPGSRVDSAATPSSESGSVVPVGALERARAYARGHDLTNCVDPAYARLDDMVLTIPREQHAAAVITPVDFDQALRSAELGRWNVLACRAADHAPGA